jgi:hypothetical protein
LRWLAVLHGKMATIRGSTAAEGESPGTCVRMPARYYQPLALEARLCGTLAIREKSR